MSVLRQRDLARDAARQAEKILQVAVADAIKKHWRAGRPVYVWRDGRVVALEPPPELAELQVREQAILDAHFGRI